MSICSLLSKKLKNCLRLEALLGLITLPLFTAIVKIVPVMALIRLANVSKKWCRMPPANYSMACCATRPFEHIFFVNETHDKLTGYTKGVVCQLFIYGRRKTRCTAVVFLRYFYLLGGNCNERDTKK